MAAKKKTKARRAKPSKALARKPLARKPATKKAKHGKTAKASRKTASKGKPLVLKQKKTTPVMPKVLTGTANLLITFDPNHKGIAEAELKEAFSRIGEKYELILTEVEGLFKAKTQDARRIVKKLADLATREAQTLSTTHRYIPIDIWCKSEVTEMQKAIKSLVPNIGQGERWRMGINKRHWDSMHSTELIIKLTDVVERSKVDLENPEKIMQVEIIGKEAGISLLRPDEFLDVFTLKH